MNRISRRSAAEAADALLEVGRTQPALEYDVEVGLARHHHWVRSEAPMPEWASAGVGPAAKSLFPVVTKTLVSAVLVGGLAVAAWHARGPQPSAAELKTSSAAAERTQSVRDLAAHEAPRPIPVPDPGLTADQPAHRTVRADAADKRAARLHRAHKDLAPARAAVRSADAQPTAPADATPMRVEPAASTTASPSEDVSVARSEVVAAPEPKPISATQKARPEAKAQAKGPDDLAEMQQVATAEQLLQRSPERALALVRQGDQHFAGGYFQQERAYIATMALIRLGRIDEARARAASFAKQYPALPYGARIRSALEKWEAAAHGTASRGADP